MALVCVCVNVVVRACASSRGDFGRHAIFSLIFIFYVIAVILAFFNCCNSITEMLKKKNNKIQKKSQIEK